MAPSWVMSISLHRHTLRKKIVDFRIFLRTCTIQSNSVITDTEGAMESVHIKRVEFRENVRVFFQRGQSKLSVITGCP